MNSIPDTLKKVRKSKKYTQEDVANKLHVTRQTISKWENGKTTPDISTLQKICEIYSINLNEFISSDISDTKNNQVSEPAKVNEENNIVFMFALIMNVTIMIILLFNLIQSSFLAYSHGVFTWAILFIMSILFILNIGALFINKNSRLYLFHLVFPIVLLILANNLV
ncbi:helix-turn-helix domain-containing protein [Vagococcus acidifermentans]|nr:helix-turn-helix transcriptional regulator [Vagococcus acidifermentans]